MDGFGEVATLSAHSGLICYARCEILYKHRYCEQMHLIASPFSSVCPSFLVE
jgi:hypothetical protein